MGNKSKWKYSTQKKCSLLKRNSWRNYFQNHRATTSKSQWIHGPNKTCRTLEINNRFSIIPNICCRWVANQMNSVLCFILICCILILHPRWAEVVNTCFAIMSLAELVAWTNGNVENNNKIKISTPLYPQIMIIISHIWQLSAILLLSV